MCAEVGYNWLTCRVCIIWKQFVWKCEKGWIGLARLRKLLIHLFSHEPFTCTQTHSHIFQSQLLYGCACTCTLKAYFVLKGMPVVCCSSLAAHCRSFSSPFALTESCMVGPVGGVKAEVCGLCQLQNKLKAVCLSVGRVVNWDPTSVQNWFQNQMIFTFFQFRLQFLKVCICLLRLCTLTLWQCFY